MNLTGSEDEPEFSPDGRWVAFNSSESGRPEVYVQPFQRPGEKVRVSDRGGMQPHWRMDGKEIVFLTQEGDVVSVDVVLGPAAISIGRSTRLFTLPITPSSFLNGYAVSSDGQRFLTSVPLEGGEQARILVTLNWAAGLAQQPQR